MSLDLLLTRLREEGAVEEGHFAKGDLHMRLRINRRRLEENTRLRAAIASNIADVFRRRRISVVLCAPGAHNALLASDIANKLDPRYVKSRYMRRSDTERRTLYLPPSTEKLIRGKGILLLNDERGGGHATRTMIQLARDNYANVVGMAIVFNLGGPISAEELGIPKMHVLWSLDTSVKSQTECRKNGPCSQGVPLLKLN